jgi:integrator complex subunit 4
VRVCALVGVRRVLAASVVVNRARGVRAASPPPPTSLVARDDADAMVVDAPPIDDECLVVALSEEHLLVALSHLDESSARMRAATRALVAGVAMANERCVLAAVLAVVANLARNPLDAPGARARARSPPPSHCLTARMRTAVLRCMRRMGRRHASMAGAIVDALLRLDRRFAPQEPNIDDLNYACVMVLLLNAAVRVGRCLHTLC